MTVPIEVTVWADRRGGDTVRVPWIGDPVGEHLAVTPDLAGRADLFTLAPGWQVVHLPTGNRILADAVCLSCARKAARKLARLPVDWAAFADKNAARQWQKEAPPKLVNKLLKIMRGRCDVAAVLDCKP